MNNRYGISRGTQQLKSTAKLASTSNAHESIAAKEADIKRFDEIMRAKRKSTHENTDSKEPGKNESSVAEDKYLSGSHIAHQPIALEQSPAHIKSGDYSLTNHLVQSQVTRIHIGTVAATSSNDTSSVKSNQAVLQIITRIIDSTKQNSVPRIWTLKIVLDEVNIIQLQVQYHGKEEWSLELQNKEGKNQELSDQLNYESQQFSDVLRRELSLEKPEIKIIDARIV